MLSIFSSISNDANSRLSTVVGDLSFGPLEILDLVVVALIVYWLYRVLRETRALGIIYGILVLIVIYVGARIMRLDLLSLLVANFLTLLFVAVPVLFQPELRRALERLGRPRVGPLRKRSEYAAVVPAVTEALQVLAQQQTGAIIVFKRTTGLSDLSTAGVALDAKVTAPLLLNLFYDKSPLHDGAVIIDNDRIVSAGVMLPLSEREYGYSLGARHRAALGISEQTDAVVAVVSEEQGTIALVSNGTITPGINPSVLGTILEEFLVQSSKHAPKRSKQK